MADIQLLKDRKNVIETFDIKQLSSMLKACDVRTFVGLRDYTIIMLLLETGIRANEMIGIAVTDIIWHDKVIRIRNAKGQNERFVPIQKKMIDQLKKYVAIRGTVDTEYLFITQDETPMSKRQLQNRIAIIGNKEGQTPLKVDQTLVALRLKGIFKSTQKPTYLPEKVHKNRPIF